MKRSQMIYEVIIYELANHSPISYENNNLEYAAKMLLKRIEEAGMKPPPYFDKEDLRLKKEEPDLFEEQLLFGYEGIYEWEPEND